MTATLVPLDHLEVAIRLLRGQRVILDSDLARLYGVPTRRLNEQVRRNLDRFPEDFMFTLTPEEVENLRSQNAISSSEAGAGKHGGRRYLPLAFTEQGVAMLSSVLRSPRAAQVNVEIMRAFVRLRRLVASHEELAARLADLEERHRADGAVVATAFQAVFAILDELKAPVKELPGFRRVPGGPLEEPPPTLTAPEPPPAPIGFQ